MNMCSNSIIKIAMIWLTCIAYTQNVVLTFLRIKHSWRMTFEYLIAVWHSSHDYLRKQCCILSNCHNIGGSCMQTMVFTSPLLVLNLVILTLVEYVGFIVSSEWPILLCAIQSGKTNRSMKRLKHITSRCLQELLLKEVERYLENHMIFLYVGDGTCIIIV